MSRWCAVTAGCRACTVWCSGVKPPNQQSSSEHAVLVWMCLPSCLWMLSQHAETRGRCSNGIANDIVRFPREPSRLLELLTASLFSDLIYCLPHHSPPFMPRYKLRLSVVSLLLEMKRDEGGRVSPLWPSAFQKMKETAAAITVTHSCLHKGSSHRLSLYPSFLIHPENLNYPSFNVLWAEATVQTFIRRKNVEMAKTSVQKHQWTVEMKSGLCWTWTNITTFQFSF